MADTTKCIKQIGHSDYMKHILSLLLLLAFILTQPSHLQAETTPSDNDSSSVRIDNDNDAPLLEALALCRKENYGAAEKILIPFIETHTDSYRANMLLGSVYTSLNRIDDAISSFETCIKLNQNIAEPYVQLGILYTEKKKPYRALEYLRTADTMKPYDFLIMHLIGNIYYILGDYDRALDYFAQSYQLNPTFLKNLLRLADVYHNNGEYTVEIGVYNEILSFKPSALIYYRLGLAFHEIGTLDREIDAYHKALELEPDNLDVQYNLGFTYFDTAQYAEAIAHLTPFAESTPPDSEAVFFLALSHLYTGDQNTAWKLYALLEQYNPQRADELYLILKNETQE